MAHGDEVFIEDPRSTLEVVPDGHAADVLSNNLTKPLVRNIEVVDTAVLRSVVEPRGEIPVGARETSLTTREHHRGGLLEGVELVG